jgi:hypothetical protein
MAHCERIHEYLIWDFKVGFDIVIFLFGELYLTFKRRLVSRKEEHELENGFPTCYRVYKADILTVVPIPQSPQEILTCFTIGAPTLATHQELVSKLLAVLCSTSSTKIPPNRNRHADIGITASTSIILPLHIILSLHTTT